jgi:hypothetical protein
MTRTRRALVPMFGIATMVAVTLLLRTPPSLYAESRLCTLVPGTTLAVIRVEKDTTLPFGPAEVQRMSSSGVRPGPLDSLLATPSTLMPAGRVRVLQLDSITRAVLVSHGVSANQPMAYVRAAPYRADCGTMRWIDTTAFVVPGEVGYVRAILAQRDQWINDVPVLIIPDAWNYPYPRRRGLAFRVAPEAPLASADAMFSLNSLLEMSRPVDRATKISADSLKRTRAIAWAIANARAAELEPTRTMLRRAVLDPDWAVASGVASRLRGTYRVDVDASGERCTWFFRTYDRPGYVWNGGDSLQTTAAMLRSPHVLGYQLVGYAAASRDSIPETMGRDRIPMVWLATTDRPTAEGNDARRVLSAVFQFTLSAAPEKMWNDLESLVLPMSAFDSAMLARLNRPRPRGEKQPLIPITIRLDANSGIRADTTIVAGTRRLRVVVERVDTLSIKRAF